MSTSAARVFAIVITYNPPPGLAARLKTIAAQVEHVIVWDNGSQRLEQAADLDSAQISWLKAPDNIGIAAAQNKAIAVAIEKGASHAVLFDHDSEPAKGMTPTLLQTMLQQQSADGPNAVAICAPRIRYALDSIRCRWPQPRWYGFRLRYAEDMPGPEPVYLAISSGMLLDLKIWQTLQGFDERLFIDLVDTEYCLHARAQGYRVLACADAELQHALGEVEQRAIAGIRMYPTHHSAWRHYMINRNRWILTRRYGFRFPGWLAYEWLGAIKLSLKALLFEPLKWQKLSAMLRGNLNGLYQACCHPRAQRHAG